MKGTFIILLLIYAFWMTSEPMVQQPQRSSLDTDVWFEPLGPLRRICSLGIQWFFDQDFSAIA